jgi:hypothetical protein
MEFARRHGIRIPTQDSREVYPAEDQVSPELESAFLAEYKQFMLELWADYLSEAEVQQIRNDEDEHYLPRLLNQRRVRLRVTENFVGAEGDHFELFTGFGGGDCGFPFRTGETYLVYAYREPGSGRWTTGVCSNTKRIREDDPDLQRVRELKAGAPVPRIYGHLVDFTSRREGEKQPGSFAAARIMLNRDGKVVQEVRTDQEGRFIFDALEPGKYRVEALASGFTATSISDSGFEIDLSSTGCSKLMLSVEEDRAVSDRKRRLSNQ